MTTRRRNLVLRWLGVGLTLAVVGLDAVDALAPLERWMYDKRVALFQGFSPPPTTDLVHVDLDDSSLEAIGGWPWPRSTIAEIIDELDRAGAKAVAMDILFSEPQPQNDARFAESIAKSGKVLVPASFAVDEPPVLSPAQVAATDVLKTDLQLSWATVASRIRAKHPNLSEREWVCARNDAVDERVVDARRTGCRSLDELRKRLLPGAASSGGSLSRVVEAAWHKQEVERMLAHFSRSVPPASMHVAAHATEQRPLVPELLRASAFGGYVDLFQPEDDGGVVRCVPLWIEHHGRLYPQMALSLACAAMGSDPASINFVEGGMTLPRPGKPDLFVPLRTARTEKFGDVGMFFDVPWFGNSEWKTMYDFPAHRETRQHIPLILAWAVADGHKRIAWNNGEADKAMRFLVDNFGYPESAKSFLAKPTAPDEFAQRGKVIEAAIKELDTYMAAYDGLKLEDLKPDEKDFVNSYNALRRAREQNADILHTLPRKAAELRDALHGKTVLIGWTATATTDNYRTPLHTQCPGVVVHGAIFNALVTGDFWRKAPFWVNALITIGVGLLTTMIVGWLEPWKALLLTGLLVASYLGLNGATLFDFGNWIVGAAGPTIAGGAVWSGLTLVRFIGEAKEKSRITRRFGSYADPNLVRFIVDHPELGHLEGRVEELTVVFTDLAGFTTLTERLREKAVPILSDYMSRMVPVIQERRGLVNKFLGDGIMFFYGAPMPNPDHAVDAVDTVLAMTGVLEQFNRELEAAGNPTVAMRAGISTGPMVVGDAGSALRSDYTVLGDAVNLGARLESANKAVGTMTLLSGRTVELLADRYLVRAIGKLRVAGKTEGVMTYEPLAPILSATEDQRHLAIISRDIFEAYDAANFAECLAAVARLEERFGESKLSKLYRELSTEYLATPPQNFDGVITLKEK